VMLFSLALSAQAEGELNFTDERKITQRAPATILSGLDIINGYPDNTFRPLAPITRAEFCKMIAMLDNGGKELTTDYTAALPAGDTTEASLRSSVGYCIAMRYALVNADGSFDSNGKITMLEAARMLLIVLGHDAEIEGFIGDEWKKNVRIETTRPRSRLFHNLPDELIANLEGELTRDYACRMFYNALTSDVVSIPSGKTTTIDDVIIRENEGVQTVANEAYDYLNRPGEKKLQLVERLFPNLRAAEDAADEFGRPCVCWVNGTKKIGPFIAHEAILAGSGVISGKSVKTKLQEDTKVTCPICRVTIEDEHEIKCPACSETFTVDSAMLKTIRTTGSCKCTNEDCGAAIAFSVEDIVPTSLEYYLNGKLQFSADVQTVVNLLGMPEVDAVGFLRNNDKIYCARLSSNTAACMLALIWRNSSYRLGKCSATTGSVSGTASYVCTYGTYNEIYFNPDSGRVTVCSMGIYPAMVNRVAPAQLDENGVEVVPAYVSANLLSGTVSPFANLELTDTVTAQTSGKTTLFLTTADAADQKYTPGEVVLLTFGYDNELGGHVVYNAYRTKATSGQISGPLSYSSAKGTTVSNFRMNGGKTRYSIVSKYFRGFPTRKFSIGDSYTIYTGVLTSTSGKATGTTMVFYAEPLAQEESIRVVYVKNAGVETSLFGEKTFHAQLVNHNGEIIDVVTDQYYGNLVDCLASYNIDAAEKYSLLKVGSSGLGKFSVKQGNAQMTLTPAKPTAITIRGDQDLDFSRERTIIADDKTLFLVGTRPSENEDMIYTAYRGIKNVPDLDSTPYYNFAELDGVASTVFIYENKSDLADSSYGMMFKTNKDLFSTYVVGTTGYYEVAAVVNDVPQTVKVTPKVYESLKYGINLFGGCTTSAEGWISSVKLLNSKYTYPITAIEPIDRGVLHMNFDANGDGGVRFMTHQDLHIYAYSLRNRTTSVITADSLNNLGATETATDLFGVNAATVKKGYYTLHETYDGKPLAGVFVIVD